MPRLHHIHIYQQVTKYQELFSVKYVKIALQQSGLFTDYLDFARKMIINETWISC